MYSRILSSSSTTSTRGRPARVRRGPSFEELVEVPAAVAAVAAGRVEGGNAALIGPLPDRALRDAEVLRGLAEGQPVRFRRRRPAPREVTISHSASKSTQSCRKIKRITA